MYNLKHELVSLKMKIEELEQEREKLHKRLEK